MVKELPGVRVRAAPRGAWASKAERVHQVCLEERVLLGESGLWVFQEGRVLLDTQVRGGDPWALLVGRDPECFARALAIPLHVFKTVVRRYKAQNPRSWILVRFELVWQIRKSVNVRTASLHNHSALPRTAELPAGGIVRRIMGHCVPNTIR